MKLRRRVILGFVIVVLFLVLLYQSEIFSIEDIEKLLGGIFFIDSITVDELQRDYSLAKRGSGKIRILIVPGHDDEYWGTEFRGLKEADLTLEVGEELYKLLGAEKEFEVFTVRAKEGYTAKFASYFTEKRESIEKFRGDYVGIMDVAVKSGWVELKDGLRHNFAPQETAIKLYGISKWANENDIDIVLHLHFNDHPRKGRLGHGKYSGYSIYVPDSQFSNSKASIALAGSVFKIFSKYLRESDLPGEDSTIIEDQELIAVGANNTLDAAVLLIEYGYIYESQFTNSQVRPAALTELAFLTFQGVREFFGEKSTGLAETSLLPYTWDLNLKKGMKGEDVLALQTALSSENLYPPPGFSKNDCPINGNFGKCTKKAVINFQKRYGIEPAVGYGGPVTRQKLNDLYSD